MAATRETHLTMEVRSEPPTKATIPRIPPQADIQAVLLSRIEGHLDRILRNLAPLAGAR